ILAGTRGAVARPAAGSGGCRRSCRPRVFSVRPPGLLAVSPVLALILPLLVVLALAAMFGRGFSPIGPPVLRHRRRARGRAEGCTEQRAHQRPPATSATQEAGQLIKARGV